MGSCRIYKINNQLFNTSFSCCNQAQGRLRIEKQKDFKEELLLSPFFEAVSWGYGDSLDRDRFERLAEGKAKILLAKERAPVLTPEQESAINDIVDEAVRERKES